MTDGTGTTSWVYDDNGRVVSVSGPHGWSVEYDYDAAGHRTKRRLKKGTTVYEWTYLYDGSGRMTSVTSPWGETTTYTSNGNGLPTQMALPNGTFTTYTYTNRSFLQALVNKKSNLEVISSFTYVYDAAGNRTKVTEADGSTMEWSYDSLDQLIQEVKKDANLTVTYDVSYTYDAVGNRLTKVDHLTNTTTNYTYNEVNEMLTAGNASYTYDANGNVTSKTENNQTTSYEWTFDNRLKKITFPDSSTITFEYNADGLRARKTTSAGTTQFVYDGTTLIAELDSNGNLLAVYTHGATGLVSQRRGRTVRSIWRMG
jgi:YD repeat-containing protein